MHAPEPWTLVRSETPEYYVYEINAGPGRVASIAGWTHFGTICPVTEGNAQLIRKAPTMLRVLKSLLQWNHFTGGWDAACWQDARDLLAEFQTLSSPADAERGGFAAPSDHGGSR
ncbi:hypothetical protein [Acidisoma sp. 7E03]